MNFLQFLETKNNNLIHTNLHKNLHKNNSFNNLIKNKINTDIQSIKNGCYIKIIYNENSKYNCYKGVVGEVIKIIPEQQKVEIRTIDFNRILLPLSHVVFTDLY